MGCLSGISLCRILQGEFLCGRVDQFLAADQPEVEQTCGIPGRAAVHAEPIVRIEKENV